MRLKTQMNLVKSRSLVDASYLSKLIAKIQSTASDYWTSFLMDALSSTEVDSREEVERGLLQREESALLKPRGENVVYFRRKS
jgi:hypothetical protein